MRTSLLAVVVLSASLGACSPGQQTTGETCVPGASIACTCTSGQEGAQVCEADGMSLSVCMCEGVSETTSGSESESESESDSDETDTDGTGETADTSDVQCGGVVNGDVDVVNDLDLAQLEIVTEIVGRLTINEDVTLTSDSLPCLTAATALTITGAHNLDFLSHVKSTEELYLNGEMQIPPTPEMAFSGDAIVGLTGTSGGQFAEESGIKQLALTDTTPCPAVEMTSVDRLTLRASPGNCEGSITHVGTLSLVEETVSPKLSVYANLTVAHSDFTDGDGDGLTFLSTLTGDQGHSVYLQNTNVTSLDWLAGVSKYDNDVLLEGNGTLTDIAGLAGSTVDGSLKISASPLLCTEHIDPAPVICHLVR
mgnify:CR=1 FL=1